NVVLGAQVDGHPGKRYGGHWQDSLKTSRRIAFTIRDETVRRKRKGAARDDSRTTPCLPGSVYFTTWDVDGSRASRGEPPRASPGTAARGVVPGRAKPLEVTRDQRA